jgi:uncharacterized protein (TIGR02058 family)
MKQVGLKRFVVELGTGSDLHGEDMTKAACRAVKDAISHGCLCGLLEIPGMGELREIVVDILVACPRPQEVDLDMVMAQAPVGRKRARAVFGGVIAQGVCVPDFAEDCDQIVMANAVVTVLVDIGGAEERES